MRNVPAEMKISVTLCTVWKLTRRDSLVLGFTDHDEDLVIGGLVYEAQAGLTPGDADASLGFVPDNGDVSGVLSSERITQADIEGGLYDGAELQISRVNWQEVSQIAVLSTGRIGDIKTTAFGFEAEWNGLAARLGHSTGRVFSRMCDASFGDVRCGLNSGDFPDGTTCARNFAACQSFNNTANYRGFPYLLGDDALTAAPHEGEIFDGESRYDHAI